MKINSAQIKKVMRISVSIIVSLILLFSVIPLSAAAQTSDSDNMDEEIKIVRVGYFENEVFQEGAKEDTVKSGYAYEYYLKLSEYTGWKYEYVYGSFTDVYQMLLDGDVDLVAGLAYKPERESLIGYPELAMGSENYSFVKHDSDSSIYADPKSFNRKRIGVLDSAMVGVLKEYLEDHEIQADVVTYSDYETLFLEFDDGKLDLLTAEGDSAYGRAHAEVLFSFGGAEYYLCVSKKRTDILDELNTAQSMLAADEPNYLNTLNTKYYPVSVPSRAFSAAEKE